MATSGSISMRRCPQTPSRSAAMSIIGADGGKSTLRSYVCDAQPTYSGYQVWRGLVPRNLAPGQPSGRNTIKGVAYETLGFPCNGPPTVGLAVEHGNLLRDTVGGRSHHQLATGRSGPGEAGGSSGVPEWFRPVRAREVFGEGATPRTGFRLATEPRQGFSVCVRAPRLGGWPAERGREGEDGGCWGDKAHMASPRTGAGAYTAMVDAVVMGRAFGKFVEGVGSLEEALEIYNEDTVRRGNALYKRSRQAAHSFCAGRN